jgi:hypothetical protein
MTDGLIAPPLTLTSWRQSPSRVSERADAAPMCLSPEALWKMSDLELIEAYCDLRRLR